MADHPTEIVSDGDERGLALGNLPIEVFDLILSKIDNRNDLLSLRLVNSVWNSSAITILERRTLQQFTKWDSSLSSDWYDWGTRRCCTFPKLYLADAKLGRKWRDASELSLAHFPRGMNKFERGRNPFPTKSLCVSGYANRDIDVDHQDRDVNKKRVSMNRLFQLYGHSLTSLQLQSVAMSCLDLQNLLETLPNLKALNLDGYSEGRKGNEVPIPAASPAPKLTHLILANYSLKVTQWLVRTLAHQLTHLEFQDKDRLPIIPLNNPSGPEQSPQAFQKLTELTIQGPRKNFLLLTGVSPTIPLERLSIYCSGSYWHPEREPSLAVIVGFIERFANTLSELCLKANAGMRSQEDFSIWSSSQIIFKRLSKFSINRIDESENTDWVRDRLLRRFPNLKTLQLYGLQSERVVEKWHEFTETEHYSRDGQLPTEADEWMRFKVEDWNFEESTSNFCEREKIWDICPKLKKIYAQCDEPGYCFVPAGRTLREVECTLTRQQPDVNED